MNVWDRLSSVERGFDDAQLRLARPDISSGPEFTAALLRALSELSGWAATVASDLDDPDERGRLMECLAAIEQLLSILRMGVAEATTREAQGNG